MRRPLIAFLALAALCVSGSTQAETPAVGRPILEGRPPVQATPPSSRTDLGQVALSSQIRRSPFADDSS